MESYGSGVSSLPLLGETIGANLERTVARVPDREALVSCHQGVRFTYAQFDEQVDVIARGLLDLGLERGDRLGLWAPNYAEWALIQYATAKAGVILVNLNPAYRTHELEYALGQSGCRVVIAAPSFKTSDYVEMMGKTAPNVASLERAIFLWSPAWDDLLSAGERVPQDRLRHRSSTLDFDQPINIQYTSGTTGSPKGATLSHHNILNNGFFVGEGCHYTESDRVCVPVPYYHCFGMVMGNLGRTTHGACVVLPGAGFEPRRSARSGSGGEVHQPVRSADDVHRRARPSRLRCVRPVVAADRDHGRLAVPGRGHETVHGRDAHGRGHHLLRHDRDLAGVHPDGGRRRHRQAGAHRRAGPPPRRGQGRRPGDRAHGAARAAPASSALAATR